jgi:hypothetical protein
MKIYIDSDCKCHAAPADGLTAVDTDFFGGKAPRYIDGYRFVPAGESWTREDGAVFAGEMVSPWKPWEELDAVQREYEREQYNSLLAQLSEVYEDAES